MNSWPPSIDSLPPELLLEVFSYLRPAYLCEVVSKVCTLWEGLCRDPCLYKTLELISEEVSLDTAIKLLRAAPSLKVLTLAIWDRDMGTILEEVSKYNRKLRVLVLKKFHYPRTIPSINMETLIESCTELQSLTFHRCTVRGKGFYKKLYKKLPNLKTLHLGNHYDEACCDAVELLVNSGLELEDLQIYDDSLYLTTIYNKSPLGAAIVAVCSRFSKTLRSLKVDSGHWTREAFSALQKCDRLETLGIVSPCSVSYEDVLAISLIPSLRRLELRGCRVPERTLIRLFSSGAWTNLVSLKLRYSNVTDEVAEAIGDQLKTLQIITLEGSPNFVDHHEVSVLMAALTARGMESIIKGCIKVCEMNLYSFDNTIKDAIMLIPEYLPGLKRFSLFSCAKALVDAVTQFKTGMPKLQLTIENWPC